VTASVKREILGVKGSRSRDSRLCVNEKREGHESLPLPDSPRRTRSCKKKEKKGGDITIGPFSYKTNGGWITRKRKRQEIWSEIGDDAR